jgi:hypothetical protein
MLYEIVESETAGNSNDMTCILDKLKPMKWQEKLTAQGMYIYINYRTVYIARVQI